MAVWLSGRLAWGAQPELPGSDAGGGIFAISYFMALLLICGAMLVVLQQSRRADRPTHDVRDDL